MTEAQMYQRMRLLWKGPRMHPTRLESWVSRGLPDVHWCFRGCEFFTELKVITKTNRLKEPLKKEQVAWLMKHARCGGNAWVVGQHEQTKLFYAWWAGDARKLSNAENRTCTLATYRCENTKRELGKMLEVLSYGDPSILQLHAPITIQF